MHLPLNSNLILLILKLLCLAGKMNNSFKFQSDSINTNRSMHIRAMSSSPLNSNLILLIRMVSQTYK